MYEVINCTYLSYSIHAYTKHIPKEIKFYNALYNIVSNIGYSQDGFSVKVYYSI